MRVLLKHREANRTVQGVLCAIQADHLARARESWIEEFQRRSRAGSRDDDSLLWERGFMSAAISATQPVPAGHVVLSEGRVEGVVVTSPESQASRKEHGAALLYVRYLATAPWNRNGVECETGVLGIGRLLVSRAVLDSVARGHEGRIGLHAFSSSSSYYESLGFDSLGADPACRGMTIFELSPSSALRPLAELGAQLVHSPEFF